MINVRLVWFFTRLIFWILLLQLYKWHEFLKKEILAGINMNLFGLKLIAANPGKLAEALKRNMY